MTPRPRWIDTDVLELIEHLFRRGTHGLLSVPPWQLGEVLLAGRCGSRRAGGSETGRAPLVRAALVELAWALRAIANLRLAAAARPQALLLLERGVAITPAALAGRLAARFGDGELLRTFLHARPAGEARRTQLLAELSLDLAPSDAGRITLALAERGAGRRGSALELLRDVLTSDPDACDAASAWLDVAAHHAAAGRLAAASRAAARSSSLLAGASGAPCARSSPSVETPPAAHRFVESVPV